MKLSLHRRLFEAKSDLVFAFSLFWFVVRVAPKPTRVMYPCQQSTLALISLRLGLGVAAISTSLSSLAKRRVVKVLLVSALVIELSYPALLQGYYGVMYTFAAPQRMTLADVQFGFPEHRIVEIHNADATSWDFSTGCYWQHVDQGTVDQMVEEGVKTLTDQPTAQAAWETILPDYNPGDVVGIKINGNDFPNFLNNDNNINTEPHLINAIIRGVKTVGVPEADIWVIEPSGGTNRYFPQYYYDIIHALYPDVPLLDRDDTSFGSNAELRVTFPYAGAQYITDQMAQIDHLIIVPIMKAITPGWGITGAIKMMQGNIQSPGDLHGYLDRTSADNPDVLIYQNPHIIGKTRLLVGDGLFGTWTGIHFTGGYGGTDTLYSPRNDVPKPWITFSNEAPNCLFFGVDPVALDCVMYDHILAERNAQDQVDGQTLAPFNEPQLRAGEAAGLGVRDHGPPYTEIDYIPEFPPSLVLPLFIMAILLVVFAYKMRSKKLSSAASSI